MIHQQILYIYIYIYIYMAFQSARFWSQLRESSMFSHNEELWYNERVCQWMTIYMPPTPVGLSSLAKEVVIATRVKKGCSGAPRVV